MTHTLPLRFSDGMERLYARYGAGVFLCVSMTALTLVLTSASFPFKIAVGIFGVLLTGSFWFFRWNLSQRASFALLMFCVGIALAGCSSAVFDTVYYRPALALDNTRVELTGVALDYGTVYDDHLRVRLLITDTGGQTAHSFYSYVYLEGNPDIAPGDTLSGWGRLYLPHSAQDFDTRQWYRSQRIYLMTEFTGTYTLNTDASLSFYLTLRYLIPARLSHWVKVRLAAITESEVSAVLSALILGDTSDLDDRYVEQMRKTGLSHITAVSGMNVSLIAGFFLLTLRRRTGSAVAIPAVLLFMLITGAGASVTRATIMELILLGSFLLNEEAGALNTLCITLSLMLLLNPYAIQDIGLILSFASTLGLILCGWRLQSWMMKPLYGRPRWVKKLLKVPVGLLSTTLCAEAFTLPLTLAVFGSFSLVAPLANLLIVWAAELAFFLGIFGIVVPVRFPGLLLGRLAALPVRYQLTLVPILARWPFPVLYADDPYAVMAVLVLYGLLVIWLLGRKTVWNADARLGRRLIGMAAVLWSLIALLAIWDAEQRLTIGILDTDGGSCTVMIQGTDCVVMNCGGLGDHAAEVLKTFLEQHGQNDIDLLMITDYNSAECSGISALREYTTIRSALLPRQSDGTLPHTSGLGTVIDAIQLESIQVGKMTFRLLTSTAEGFDHNRMAIYAATARTSLLYPGSIAPENLSALLQERGITEVQLLAGSSYYTTHSLPVSCKLCCMPSYIGLNEEQRQTLLNTGATVIDLHESGTAEITVRFR